MKIKYLGTAAYEGVPSLFCKCRVCRLSRKAGGRNIRTRSQALVNDDLLIDFPPDTVVHYQQHGFDWEKIEGIIITHNHSDHLYPEDLDMARSDYTHEHRPIHVYSAISGFDHINSKIEHVKNGELKVHLIRAGERFRVGEYRILPLCADHGPDTSPVIYSIERDGKRLLYAHDTGIFPEETFKALGKEGHYDLISLDCTGCTGSPSVYRNNHMCMVTHEEVISRLRSLGAVDDSTRIVVNHFSHNGGQTYDELAEEAEKRGVTVSYDGLEIKF